MLSKLRLWDWKPFEEASVRFYPGINLISGSNGSGKSSLLEAISFALYGERALPFELSAALRRGTTQSKVRLSFTGPDGNEYMVERVLRLKSREGAEARAVSDSAASKFFHPDGVPATGTRKVDDEVLEHLGVPARAFLEALNIRQGELRRIIELRGVERGQYLDRLIGISGLEDCYSRAGELESWSKLNLQGAQLKEKSLQEAIQPLDEVEASLEVARDQELELGSLLEAKRLELTRVQARLQHLQGLQVKLGGVEAELGPLESSLLRLNGYLDESKRALGELEEAEFERQSIEAALKAKPGLEERRSREEAARRLILASFTSPERLRKDRESVESKLREAYRDVEGLPAKLADLEASASKEAELEAEVSRYGEVSKSYEELSSLTAGVKAELANLETTLRNLKDNVDRNCPTCLQPVTAEYAKRVSSQLSERLRRLEADLSSLERGRSVKRLEKETLEEKGSRLRRTAVEATVLRGEVDRLKRRLDEVTELERQRAQLEVTLGKAYADEKELRRLEGEAQVITSRLAELERVLGRLEDISKRLAGRAAVEERVRRLGEESEALQLKVSALRVEEARLRASFNLAELDSLALQVDDVNKEVLGFTEELGTIKERVSDLTERVRELREKQAQLAYARSEVEKWGKVADLTLQVRGAFRGSQSTLRKQFIDSINVEAEQIFLDIRRKRRLDSLMLETDYGIYVSEGGERYPISAYSGGERTLAAIVLRTAIAKTVLGEVPLLIYDEPTEYLDPDHRESLVNWLKDYGEVRQVIVVSNLADFEDVADNVVRVSMGEGGTSTVD